MEELKHTPGPWRWEFIGTMGIDKLVTGSIEDNTFQYVDSEDDKKLQAAAPEMLEALIAIHVHFLPFALKDQMGEDYDKITNAINKAIN